MSAGYWFHQEEPVRLSCSGRRRRIQEDMSQRIHQSSNVNRHSDRGQKWGDEVVEQSGLRSKSKSQRGMRRDLEEERYIVVEGSVQGTTCSQFSAVQVMINMTNPTGCPELRVASRILGFSVQFNIESGLQKHCTARAAKEAIFAVGAQREPLEIFY